VAVDHVPDDAPRSEAATAAVDNDAHESETDVLIFKRFSPLKWK
jgi:hypothetical protein